MHLVTVIVSVKSVNRLCFELQCISIDCAVSYSLPRDTMRKCGSIHQLVLVLPSATLVYYVEMVEDIVKLFSQPDSSIILLF